MAHTHFHNMPLKQNAAFLTLSFMCYFLFFLLSSVFWAVTISRLGFQCLWDLQPQTQHRSAAKVHCNKDLNVTPFPHLSLLISVRLSGDGERKDPRICVICVTGTNCSLQQCYITQHVHIFVFRYQGGITEGLVKGALSVAASAYKALFTGPNCSIQVQHTDTHLWEALPIPSRIFIAVIRGYAQEEVRLSTLVTGSNERYCCAASAGCVSRWQFVINFCKVIMCFQCSSAVKTLWLLNEPRSYHNRMVRRDS